MTKEKKVSLIKYMTELSHKLTAEPSAKHVRRGSQKEYKDFLKLEIARTKAVVDEATLAESGK